MRQIVRAVSFVVVAVALTLPVEAQTREGLMGDLLKDVDDVHSKVVGLAKAMPAEAHTWRPMAGVRSTEEVFKLVASDNYFLPAAMGITPPPDSGINGKDYKTTLAYEKRTMTRDQLIAELDKSFAFLKTSMQGMSDAQLEAGLAVFGQKMTNRALWISTVTHLHEHLGQLIAYARSNKVTPPWSK
jgi:hypothetical protein